MFLGDTSQQQRYIGLHAAPDTPVAVGEREDTSEHKSGRDAVQEHGFLAGLFPGASGTQADARQGSALSEYEHYSGGDYGAAHILHSFFEV